MRNLILIFFISFTSFSGFGQYVRFPDSNAIWSNSNQKYFIDGDSTFNNINYKKYKLTNDSIVTTGNFYALVRQDSNNKQIFTIRSGETKESILYDFSLSVNDTTSVFPLSFPYHSGPISVIVDSIDSVKIGSEYRRRLKISGVNENTGFAEYWIEGIGSTMGLFNSGITGIVVFDVRYGVLLCFEENGVLLYRDSNANTCYQSPTIGLAESVIKNQIVFFPNPVISSFTIESNDEIQLFRTYSMTGKLFEQRKCHKKLIEVDVTDYPSGVYLIMVQTKNSIISKRIIKNDI